MKPSSSFLDRSWAALEDLAEFAARQADSLAREGLSRTVRVGITGLARSGKTVFTAALVHNFMLARSRPELMPFLPVVERGRILAARLEAPRRRRPFPFDRALDLLTRGEPVWPPQTRDITELRLAIDYRPQGLLARNLAGQATLTLVIVDYPGEWLLDLPLLRKDFAQWSAEVIAACEQGPRERLSAEWRRILARLEPGLPAAGQPVAEAVAAYKAFLEACRRPEIGLSLVQPGRFLLPGDADPALLAFCPLPAGADAAGSLRQEMARRYQAYCRQVVEPFYRDHFRQFDRQAVLVDLLTALNTSHAAFVDARDALRQILESFDYGRLGWIRRLFDLRVARVLFAATKADHITVNQYNNLRLLLQAMVAGEASAIEAEGAKVAFELVAAIRSTRHATLAFQGHSVAALQGVPEGERQERVLYPGEIPGAFPGPEAWADQPFRFIDFKPPNLADAGRRGFRSVNLDRALGFLIGDSFS
jgi:predicted YcjX-like family ATPase